MSLGDKELRLWSYRSISFWLICTTWIFCLQCITCFFFPVQALLQLWVLHKISCITWLLSIFNLHHNLHSWPWVGRCRVSSSSSWLTWFFSCTNCVQLYTKLSRSHSATFSSFNIKGFGFDLKNEISRWWAITHNRLLLSCKIGEGGQALRFK